MFAWWCKGKPLPQPLIPARLVSGSKAFYFMFKLYLAGGFRSEPYWQWYEKSLHSLSFQGHSSLLIFCAKILILTNIAPNVTSHLQVFGVYYIGTAVGDLSGIRGAEAFYYSTIVGRIVRDAINLCLPKFPYMHVGSHASQYRLLGRTDQANCSLSNARLNQLKRISMTKTKKIPSDALHLLAPVCCWTVYFLELRLARLRACSSVCTSDCKWFRIFVRLDMTSPS